MYVQRNISREKEGNPAPLDGVNEPRGHQARPTGQTLDDFACVRFPPTAPFTEREQNGDCRGRREPRGTRDSCSMEVGVSVWEHGDGLGTVGIDGCLTA